MPKFIIKHGCCYIPTLSTTPSTCQVYTNPEFDNAAPSAPFCGMLKSTPEFNQQKKQISWGHLDVDFTPGVNADSSTQQTNPDLIAINTQSQNYSESHTNPLSFITLYNFRIIESTENSSPQSSSSPCQNVSESSVYGPSSKRQRKDLSRKDKFLDNFSMCLWKCASWC